MSIVEVLIGRIILKIVSAYIFICMHFMQSSLFGTQKSQIL